MTATHASTPVGTTTGATAVAHASGFTDVAVDSPAARVVGVLRIGFGLTFLWAFFDKLLALGYSTGAGDDGTVDRFGPAAWIHGASPTNGFLAFGAEGPFKGFYNAIAGNPVIDVLFMGALLLLGVALTSGVATRIAGIGGAVLYVMMWTVALPPANNPVLDEHVLGAITLLALALLGAGNTWGLGRRAAELNVVKRFPVLR